MLDKVLAILTMAGLVAFMGLVTIYINEPDLWIIVILVLAMGIFDFVRELRGKEKPH
jgi:hypothetical protein